MPQIKKILFPVDFSEGCRSAARYAEALAGRFEAELMLIHVVGAGEHNSAEQLLPLRRAQLNTLLADELRQFSTQRVCITGDDVTAAIKKAALDWQPDLVIMPTHGLGTFRRLLLGSVTAKLLHDLQVPVWTSVHRSPAPRLEDVHCRKIVCALDLSEQSREVLEWAGWLAAEYGACLRIAHATPRWPTGYEGGYPEDILASVAASARKSIEGLLRDTGICADIFMEPGEAGDVVSLAATAFAADLVVTGRRRGERFAAMFFHSAYSIVRDSPCPVISV